VLPIVAVTEQRALLRVHVVAENVMLAVPVWVQVIVPEGLCPTTQAMQLMALVLPNVTVPGSQSACVTEPLRFTVIVKVPLEGALRLSPP